MTKTLPHPLTCRPATMDDLEAAVDLFNACSREQIGKDAYDAATLRTEWENPAFDLHDDVRVVQTPEGEMVGYMEVWSPKPHVRPYFWGRTHPSYAGQGIGGYLLAWAEERAGEIAAMNLCNPQITEDPEMGWVGTLGVRRRWRRRGLAQALLRHAFGEFYRRGTRKVGLAVDAQSLTGATRLYEKVGMHVTRTYTDYEKELRSGEDLTTQEVTE